MSEIKNTEAMLERKREFKTTVDGTVVNRVYTPADLVGLSQEDIGLPGKYPFTRHIMPNGYRGRLWTMRQYAGFGSVEETNERYKYLYRQGQTGFSVAFHLPTQEGYDSDHPLAAGEVGKCGAAIDSLEDMERLWLGIPLAKVSTSMTINATAPTLLAMYIAAAEKQGVSQSKLRGTVQNDILKEYIARNTYIFGPTPSMRLVTDICAYCAQNMPEWNSISISGYHMREAGATASQEAGFTIANGIAYVQAMIDRGMEVDSFATRFSFFLAAYTNLLEEVAKFRALRRIWARIMKERFGAKNPRSMMLRFHVQTDGFTLTEQQPLNNIARVTLQALAAVLGGCQSLHTNSFDEALALPSEEAVQVALRTQQIIAYESGTTHTVDPLGGSYYIEWLTNQIENKAMEYISEIDKMGGALKAIESGYVQREISNSAYNYQRAVDSNEQVVVGVNKFIAKDEHEPKILEIGMETEWKQIEGLKRLKRERDNQKVNEVLNRVREVARSSQNIMPVLIEAVKAYATVGEISDALREVFGEYREPGILQIGSVVRNRKIRVLIAKPGLDGHDRGAKVVARGLRDAGMEVIYLGLRLTPEQIAEAAIQEDVNVVGIDCLSGAHMTLFPRTVQLIREKGGKDILVIGGGIIPKKDIPKLKEAGIARIFGPGTPIDEISSFITTNLVERGNNDKEN